MILLRALPFRILAAVGLCTALYGEPSTGPGRVYTISGLGLTMLQVMPGSFDMGAGSAKEDRRTQVKLTRAFWLGRTEITQDQWLAIMGNSPSIFKGGQLPVENVTWEEAMEFCRRLTRTEAQAGRLPAGHVYTLPTEAQWEYACRAGSAGDYAGEPGELAWYDANSGVEFKDKEPVPGTGGTHAVGQKKANAWGFRDLHGNVWEWCRDWYAEPLPDGPLVDPEGPTEGTLRVIRGGSWDYFAYVCRSAFRGRDKPGDRFNNLGFRIALVPAVGRAAQAY